MGRPIRKKFFGNTNLPPIGGEGVASYTVGGANNNYTAIPTITSIGAPNLPGGVQATASITNMVGKTATVVVSGTGSATADYEPGDILTIVGGTGTPATFTVSSVNVRVAEVQDAGTNTWSTGDTVTFSTGWAIPAVLTITDDGFGGIASVTITDAGVLSAALPLQPLIPDSTTNISGDVNGATFNIGFGVNAVSLLDGGLYTVLPANPVATTTDSAAGTGATLTVNYGVGAVAVVVAGSGYSSAPTVTLSGGNAAVTAVLGNVNQNAIDVVAWVPGGSSGVAGDIVKQEASRRYLVTTAQGTGQCRLVAAAPATGGEMTMLATDSAGGTYYVTKLTANLALLIKGDRTGTQFTSGTEVKWTMSSPVLGYSVQLASV